MGDVTDLDPGRERTGRTRRKARRAKRRPAPSASPIDPDATETPPRAGYCTTCQVGLHAKCVDYLDFAFGTKAAETLCGCGCFTGTEIRPRAIRDMMDRQPEYAMQWLYIRSRIQGHVHVCGSTKRSVL